jgi:hypothetical protein
MPGTCKDLEEWFSDFSIQQNNLEGLLKCRLLRPILRVSTSPSLRRGLRISILNRFLDNTDAAGTPSPFRTTTTQ